MTPDWLTAIGTLLTAAVAAAIALGQPYLASRYTKARRPKLQISFDRDQGVDTRIKPDRRTVRYRLKIVVTNSGPTSAQGVTAYLTEYVARTYQPLGQTPYARFEIDPVPLPWISRPAPLPPDQRERVTIQPNMAQSAAVATYDTASWELALLSTTSKGFTPALPIAPATSEHWLTVVVSSDNAEPTSAILYFETVLPEPGNKLAEGKDARLVDSLPDPNQTTSWETVDHDNP